MATVVIRLIGTDEEIIKFDNMDIDTTVSDLKVMITKGRKMSCNPQSLMLFYNKVLMRDVKTMSFYRMDEGNEYIINMISKDVKQDNQSRENRVEKESINGRDCPMKSIVNLMIRLEPEKGEMPFFYKPNFNLLDRPIDTRINQTVMMMNSFLEELDDEYKDMYRRIVDINNKVEEKYRKVIMAQYYGILFFLMNMYKLINNINLCITKEYSIEKMMIIIEKLNICIKSMNEITDNIEEKVEYHYNIVNYGEREGLNKVEEKKVISEILMIGEGIRQCTIKHLNELKNEFKRIRNIF